MELHISEDDDKTMRIRVDAEGVDWLIQGLEQIRDMPAGEKLSSPSLVSNEDGPVGVADLVLERVPDS